MNCKTEWISNQGWVVTGHFIPLNEECCIYCGLPYEDLEYFLSKAKVLFSVGPDPHEEQKP